MNLDQYYGKRVRLTDINGNVYSGEVKHYTSANDNGDIGEASIAVSPCMLEFPESYIHSVEVIDDRSEGTVLVVEGKE